MTDIQKLKDFIRDLPDDARVEFKWRTDVYESDESFGVEVFKELVEGE